MDRNQELKLQISSNIKRIMKSKGMTQLNLADKTGISKSTISDYLNNKTLINPDNVQKVADALNVKKSEIDPTFKKQQTNSFETIAAHLDGELTDEQWKKVIEYARFIKDNDDK